MIISQIVGGLGNQMFQYAAARALSLHRGTSLRLDVSKFSNYKLHQGFELNRIFSCSAKIATKSDMLRVLGWQYPSLVQRILSRQQMSIFRHSGGLIVEPGFKYWPGIRQVKDDSYLTGYWQSEKYFQNEASAIRTDFTFKQLLSKRNAALAEKIANVNSISLHVRRGDYANDAKTAAVHGLCSTDFYSAAIKYICARVESPYLYVFSDDMDWVKKNLITGVKTEYIDHNRGPESHNDMRLMSLCCHHIIANSSFSWWGAWLNPSPQKLVLAPKRWFVAQTDTGDLFPERWQTL